MTLPAIEDLQPVQAKMSAAISSLYEAVAEAAKLELSVGTLRGLVDLVESAQKSRDKLLRECERPEPEADTPPGVLQGISNRRLEDFIRRHQSGVVDHGTPLFKRGDLIGFVNLPEHNERNYH